MCPRTRGAARSGTAASFFGPQPKNPRGEVHEDFVSEHIENGPPGLRARRTLELVTDDEIRDQFELAGRGKDFRTVLENRLRRAPPEP